MEAQYPLDKDRQAGLPPFWIHGRRADGTEVRLCQTDGRNEPQLVWLPAGPDGVFPQTDPDAGRFAMQFFDYMTALAFDSVCEECRRLYGRATGNAPKGEWPGRTWVK